MTSPRTSALRLFLVGTLAVGGAVAPVSAAQAAPVPELTGMVLHLPRVNFNYQLVAGDSFRVTFTIDRPAPAGGTLIEVRKFRDSGADPHPAATGHRAGRADHRRAGRRVGTH